MKPRIDDALDLSVFSLRRQGLLDIRTLVHMYQWQNCPFCVLVWFDPDTEDPKLRIKYHLPNEPEPREYFIHLTVVSCRFGGVRYFLHCPNCLTRVAKLYLCHSIFTCRHCQDLAYRSKNESKVYRKLIYKDQELIWKEQTIRKHYYKGFTLTKRYGRLVNKRRRLGIEKQLLPSKPVDFSRYGRHQTN